VKFILIASFLLSSIGFCSDVIMIGIAGGSGSGKTTVAHKIQEVFPDDCVLISQDFYYKDLGHLFMKEREKTNFDHPDSIDFALMRKQLIALKERQAIDVPQYDFTTHSRKKDILTVTPKQIIVVEGLHLLAMPEIKELFDLKLFVDADEDLRLIRRINRDQAERGRTVPHILEQYLATVRPMYLEFIEPSKRHADLIIPEGGYNQPAVDVIIAKLKIDLLKSLEQFSALRTP